MSWTSNQWGSVRARSSLFNLLPISSLYTLLSISTPFYSTSLVLLNRNCFESHSTLSPIPLWVPFHIWSPIPFEAHSTFQIQFHSTFHECHSVMNVDRYPISLKSSKPQLSLMWKPSTSTTCRPRRIHHCACQYIHGFPDRLRNVGWSSWLTRGRH